MMTTTSKEHLANNGARAGSPRRNGTGPVELLLQVSEPDLLRGAVQTQRTRAYQSTPWRR